MTSRTFISGGLAARISLNTTPSLDRHNSAMTTARTKIQHCLFDTAIGPCGVAWSERGLTGVQLPEADRAATERRLTAKSASAGAADPPPWVQAVIADIARYLGGERIDFAAVAVDLAGVDPFRRTLYETMRAIDWGSTTTYGELARKAGWRDPEAARDVGQAMGQNPLPLVIPCHRVVAAGKKIGGFSAYGGTVTKERLLALEGGGGDAPRLPGL
jgi:methylated-DNA-[protein]-cysteine S-methyltransferase